MFFFFGGLPFLIIAIALIALLSGKAEPDPAHERPRALYLTAISYVAVLIALSASFFIVQGLVGFTGAGSSQSVSISGGGFEGGFQDYRVDRNHDGDVAAIAGGLIAGALAVGLLAFHLPKLRAYEATPSGPGARVYARYLYLVCFAAALVGVSVVGAALYQLLAALAPDTLGNGDRGDAFRNVAKGLGFALVPGFLALRHWLAAEDLQAARRSALVIETAERVEEPVADPASPVRARKATPPTT